MIGTEKKLALGEVHQQRNEIVSAALNLKVLAFRDPINTHVHLGAAGHLNGDLLAEEEVRVAAQDLCGVDGVMIGYGDDGHAHLLQPVIDFTGVVVGLPANPIQPGDGEHSRGDRMNVKVTAHGANCLLSI